MTESNNLKSRIFVYGFELEAPVFKKYWPRVSVTRGHVPIRKFVKYMHYDRKLKSSVRPDYHVLHVFEVSNPNIGNIEYFPPISSALLNRHPRSHC